MFIFRAGIRLRKATPDKRGLPLQILSPTRMHPGRFNLGSDPTNHFPRIVGMLDGTTDDQVIGPVTDRLTRCDNSLLIIIGDRLIGRADTGCHR